MTPRGQRGNAGRIANCVRACVRAWVLARSSCSDAQAFVVVRVARRAPRPDSQEHTRARKKSVRCGAPTTPARRPQSINHRSNERPGTPARPPSSASIAPAPLHPPLPGSNSISRMCSRCARGRARGVPATRHEQRQRPRPVVTARSPGALAQWPINQPKPPANRTEPKSTHGFAL